jgi:hypothetical protein
MRLFLYLSGRLLHYALLALNGPLDWFDHHFWINVERRPGLGGLGVGSWVGLWMMRTSANLEALGRRP